MSKQSERPLQLPVGRPEINFKASVIYGYVDIQSWFEWDGEKLVGMGSKTVYDRDGRIVEHSISPTGCSMTFEGPLPSGFGGWFSRWFKSPNAEIEVRDDKS